MSASELHPHELMQQVVSLLEAWNVPYRIVGSMASMAWGEPRFTNDVGILVDFPVTAIDRLCKSLPPPDYYISADAALQAIRARHQFSIIHIPSGLKVDMILTSGSPFDRLNLTSGVRIKGDGYDAAYASPENVILMKLVFFRNGGSDKHLRDIAGVLSVQGDRIDFRYLEIWAKELRVTGELKLVLAENPESN